MGLWHRFQHIVMANTVTYVIEIEDELWWVAECKRCGAELGRWFYRHQMRRRRR
jgi:hypothetical protein